MLRKSLIMMMLLGSLGAGAGGCTTAKVLEITYKTSITDHVAIAGAIERALLAKGWGIESHTLGTFLARISVGGHFARIEVAYDQVAYRIRHVETSPSLKYNGTTIHRRYNRWVAALDATIMRELKLGAVGGTRRAPVEPADPGPIGPG